MKLRMFDANGMDAPWRMRAGLTEVDDAEVVSFKLNPDGSDVNQIVAASVDHYRASTWWFEPNLGSAETPAEIHLKTCVSGTNDCYGINSGSTMNQRTQENANFGRDEYWTVKLTGVDVPASTNSSYYNGLDTRLVAFVGWYED
jgi:hypothetical protein